MSRPDRKIPTTVVLDISGFASCFKKTSEYAQFVMAVNEMVRQLSEKIIEHETTDVRVKVEPENE